MFDLLTTSEAEHAADHGWELRPVYDLGKTRWALEVLPIDHPDTSAVAAQMTVYSLAQHGDAVAIKALQLVVRSHQPAPSAKKGKKK